MSAPALPSPVPPERVVELPGHKDLVRNVVEMPDGRRVATAGQDNFVRVFDAQTGDLLHSLTGHTSWVTGLAPLGKDLLASGGASGDKTLRVWDTSTGSCLSKRNMGGCVLAIAALGMGEMVMSAGADLVYVAHDDGQGLVETRRVRRAHEGWINDLAVGGGRVVTGSDDHSVRVWDARSGARIADLKGHRSLVTSVSVRGNWMASCSYDGSVRVYSMETLELVRSFDALHGGEWIDGVDVFGGDVGYVVSAGWDKMVCVTELKTGKVTVRGNLDSEPLRLRLLRDGRIVAVGSGGKAKIFLLSPGSPDFFRSPPAVPNPIEAAFYTAIAGEEKGDVLSADLLATVLVRKNVDSVHALFWAHNLVLLAIRCEILTRDKIHSFGGAAFYLMEEVYFPVSKLVLSDDEKLVAKKILAHAESVGIINNGFDTVAAWDLREAARCDLGAVSKALSDMAERIVNVETRLRDVESRVDGVMQWTHTAKSKINELVDLSEARKREVMQLSQSFSELHSRLRKNEKRMRVVSVTRAALSLIPVVGSAVGNVSYAAAEILLGLSTEDVVEAGVGAAKGTVSLLGGVDVSNFTAARRLLSEKTLDHLGPAVKSVVFAAAESSSFQSFSELEKALGEASQSLGAEAGHGVALLDVGDKSWMETPLVGPTPGSGPSNAAQEHDMAAWVAERFRFLCAADEGNDDLLLERAAAELVPILSKAGCRESVDENTRWDALEEACGEDGVGRVDETAFITAFKGLVEKFNTVSVREESHPAFSERFTNTAGTYSRVMIRTARIALVRLFKDRMKKDTGADGDSSLNFRSVATELSKEDAENVLRECCAAKQVDEVGEEEFVEACRCIFYGEKVDVQVGIVP